MDTVFCAFEVVGLPASLAFGSARLAHLGGGRRGSSLQSALLRAGGEAEGIGAFLGDGLGAEWLASGINNWNCFGLVSTSEDIVNATDSQTNNRLTFGLVRSSGALGVFG